MNHECNHDKMCKVWDGLFNAVQIRDIRMPGMPVSESFVSRKRSGRCIKRTGEDKKMTKCMLPTCNKEGAIKVTTPDGKTHTYCSIEHMNDHRNILIHELMRK